MAQGRKEEEKRMGPNWCCRAGIPESISISTVCPWGEGFANCLHTPGTTQNLSHKSFGKCGQIGLDTQCQVVYYANSVSGYSAKKGNTYIAALCGTYLLIYLFYGQYLPEYQATLGQKDLHESRKGLNLGDQQKKIDSKLSWSILPRIVSKV